MKIRYVDLFIVNCFLSKYSSCVAGRINASRYLNYYVSLNREIVSLPLNHARREVSSICSSYYFFKFSIYYVLLNFLLTTRSNKFKSMYFFICSHHMQSYILNLLTVYCKFISINENVVCVTKNSMQFLEKAHGLNNFKDISLINYLLRNKIKLVIDMNDSLSNIFLCKLSEFDIYVVRLGCVNDNAQ
jgi:hypothetical protein